MKYYNHTIVKTPKGWSSSKRYECLRNDRFLCLWVKYGLYDRYPDWCFKYNGQFGRISAEWSNNKLKIEIVAYKEEFGLTFGLNVHRKNQVPGTDIMVWGPEECPYSDEALNEDDALAKMEDWVRLGYQGIMVKLAMMEVI